MLSCRALPRGILEELQGELGRQTVERICARQTRGRPGKVPARPSGQAAPLHPWALNQSPHSRDFRGDHTKVEGHRAQFQHLLPQVVKPGVNGSIRPEERAQVTVCSDPGHGGATGDTLSHTHPSSCWSSPRHMGRRALPPSCSSRRYSFLATKLNLCRQ